MAMSSFDSSILLAVVTLLEGAHPLNSCPVADNVFTGTGGIRYWVCPDTDFVGESTSVTANVASTTACTQACDQNIGCFKAAEQINIARCPYTETIYTAAGRIFKICRDTDLGGGSAQILNNVVTLNDCAQRCSTIAACVQAVYDSSGQVCHIKVDAKTNALIWSTDKRFDVIRQDVAAAPATNGAWSDMIRLPVIPVAAYVVPEYPSAQRLLVFSSWGSDAFGSEGKLTQFADYNFNSNAVSAHTVSNTQHDMFCPAIISLQDGRILIQGGSDAAATSFYDPKTNAFTLGPNMKMARGYQVSVTLSDNRIFKIGGAYSGPRQDKDGEVYNAATDTWTALSGAKVAPILTTDAEGIWREENHAWLFAWKNSTVFQAGPSKAMNWYGTSGTGTQTAAGTRDTIDDSIAGGSPDYTNSDANARAHITTIDTPNINAAVERVADMAYPRGFANAVVLPDGTVLVTGGQRRSLVFTDTDSILYAELFNPATKIWKTLAPEAVPRNYHSVSILLADGRVFSGDGGLCYIAQVGASSSNCNKLVNHADGQVLSPPYLFNADGSATTRPSISSLSATSVKVGGRLTITTSASATGLKFVLVRIGSVTHSVNSDQRRIPLASVTGSGTSYTTTLPNDSGILIPGAYYVFVISAQGVPSIARTLQVTL
ncbi:galactose oxidase-like protein precursor [Setomelanomma holmii]|uniref:Galactose oxidase-like protein n=1 Tax=Setomelanomma holmii TaxID=210430 RepID=A0A9P4GWM9_9PLEO|nr:galactose oxidase-like protein precursor [Setomelanomma holmii]